MERKINISPAPHIRSNNTVNKIMIDMIIALLPAAGAGIYFYGKDAVKILVASTLSALVIEMLWNKFVKKTSFLTDLSPIVTGLMMGLILPTHVPLWIPVIASIFAIIVVKQFFGGLGQNFMNPVAAAKAFLIASWAGVMAEPVVDTVAAASEVVEETVTLMDQIIGQASGSIGETSILAIAVGALYLALRGRISLRAPLAFLVSGYAMNLYLGKEGLLSGAFFFAAIFMASDYATSPMTRVGQYIFGIGLGVTASVISVLGYNPEGPYYAIIIMNLVVPMIEYFTTKKFKKEVA